MGPRRSNADERVKEALSKLSRAHGIGNQAKSVIELIESYLLVVNGIDAGMDTFNGAKRNDPGRMKDALKEIKRQDRVLEEVKKKSFKLKDSFYKLSPLPLELLENIDVVESAIREQQSRISEHVTMKPRQLPSSGSAEAPDGLGAWNSKGTVRVPFATGSQAKTIILLVVIIILFSVGFNTLYLVPPLGVACLILAVFLVLRNIPALNRLGSSTKPCKRIFVCNACNQEIEGPTSAGLCPKCGSLFGEFEVD